MSMIEKNSQKVYTFEELLASEGYFIYTNVLMKSEIRRLLLESFVR